MGFTEPAGNSGVCWAQLQDAVDVDQSGRGAEVQGSLFPVRNHCGGFGKNRFLPLTSRWSGGPRVQRPVLRFFVHCSSALSAVAPPTLLQCSWWNPTKEGEKNQQLGLVNNCLDHEPRLIGPWLRSGPPPTHTHTLTIQITCFTCSSPIRAPCKRAVLVVVGGVGGGRRGVLTTSHSVSLLNTNAAVFFTNFFSNETSRAPKIRYNFFVLASNFHKLESLQHDSLF